MLWYCSKVPRKVKVRSVLLRDSPIVQTSLVNNREHNPKVSPQLSKQLSEIKRNKHNNLKMMVVRLSLLMLCLKVKEAIKFLPIIAQRMRIVTMMILMSIRT
jgi:DNA polymerase elongation subunit (family B)